MYVFHIYNSIKILRDAQGSSLEYMYRVTVYKALSERRPF